MEDRIQVMSWLEGLAQPDWHMFHSDSEVQNIARAALDLLKEQKTDFIQISPAKIYECRMCGKQVATNDIDQYKYCHGCGRRCSGDG